jgi:hypothetical protein
LVPCTLRPSGNLVKKIKTRTKDEKTMTDQTKKEEKKARKMNQHGKFGLGLRKSCDPGAYQGVGFGTTLRPRVTPLRTSTFPRTFFLLSLHSMVGAWAGA